MSGTVAIFTHFVALEVVDQVQVKLANDVQKLASFGSARWDISGSIYRDGSCRENSRFDD